MSLSMRGRGGIIGAVACGERWEREREKVRGRRKPQTSVAKLGISPSKAQQKLAQGIGKVGRKRGCGGECRLMSETRR